MTQSGSPITAVLLLLLCVPVLACERRGDTDSPPAAASAPADAAVAGVGGHGDVALIGPDEIGVARHGMTVAQIRAALGSEARIGEVMDYMLDFVSLPVVYGRDTLYHLVFPDVEQPGDAMVPSFVATTNHGVRTAEGIGPGSTLDEAAAHYGRPRLSYNIDDEMREYATFPRYPHPGFTWFRVEPGEIEFLVGRYGEGDGYYETDDFDGSGRIMMIFIDLRRERDWGM